MNWSVLFSAVMAYRLRVPVDALGGSPANIPFLDDRDNSVEEKVAWINKFNYSNKKFTVNNWKDCRKQQRISQMLPEPLYIETLEKMISWDIYDDLSWELSEPIDYDALYNNEPVYDD